MSHWLQDFLGTLWFMRLPRPPPTSSYGFSVRFSGRLLELWLRVIMGTALGLSGAFRGVVEAAGHPGTMRWPEGEVGGSGVKVKPDQSGVVVERAPPLLVWLCGPWKALLELRFSMEWKMGLFPDGGSQFEHFNEEHIFLCNQKKQSIYS